MRTKKFLVLLLAFCMLFSTSALAFADSNVPEDSAMAKYIYKTYAPKSQTSYKTFATYTNDVKSIKDEGDRLVVQGSDIMAGAVVGGGLAYKIPIIGVSIGIIGGTEYFMGRGLQVRYSDFKDDAKVKTKVSFKWTDAEQFEYKVKIESWVEYNGKKVSGCKTVTNYRTGDLY